MTNPTPPPKPNVRCPFCGCYGGHNYNITHGAGKS